MGNTHRSSYANTSGESFDLSDIGDVSHKKENSKKLSLDICKYGI